MRLYIMVIAFAFSSWLTAVQAQTPVIGSVTDDYPQLHTGIATLYINSHRQRPCEQGVLFQLHGAHGGKRLDDNIHHRYIQRWKGRHTRTWQLHMVGCREKALAHQVQDQTTAFG